MKKLLSKIAEIISDENNRLSSKRIVGVMCSIFLCMSLYKSSCCEAQTQPSSALVETIGAVTIGCLGLSSLDKFTKRKHEKTEAPTEPTQP